MIPIFIGVYASSVKLSQIVPIIDLVYASMESVRQAYVQKSSGQVQHDFVSMESFTEGSVQDSEHAYFFTAVEHRGGFTFSNSNPMEISRTPGVTVPNDNSEFIFPAICKIRYDGDFDIKHFITTPGSVNSYISQWPNIGSSEEYTAIGASDLYVYAVSSIRGLPYLPGQPVHPFLSSDRKGIYNVLIAFDKTTLQPVNHAIFYGTVSQNPTITAEVEYDASIINSCVTGDSVYTIYVVNHVYPNTRYAFSDFSLSPSIVLVKWSADLSTHTVLFSTRAAFNDSSTRFVFSYDGTQVNKPDPYWLIYFNRFVNYGDIYVAASKNGQHLYLFSEMIKILPIGATPSNPTTPTVYVGNTGNSFETYYTVTKLNPNTGDVIWSKVIGNSEAMSIDDIEGFMNAESYEDSYRVYASNIYVADDGSFIANPYVYTDGSYNAAISIGSEFGGTSSAEYRIMYKMDANGDIVWQKEIPKIFRKVDPGYVGDDPYVITYERRFDHSIRVNYDTGEISLALASSDFAFAEPNAFNRLIAKCNLHFDVMTGELKNFQFLDKLYSLYQSDTSSRFYGYQKEEYTDDIHNAIQFVVNDTLIDMDLSFPYWSDRSLDVYDEFFSQSSVSIGSLTGTYNDITPRLYVDPRGPELFITKRSTSENRGTDSLGNFLTSSFIEVNDLNDFTINDPIYISYALRNYPSILKTFSTPVEEHFWRTSNPAPVGAYSVIRDAFTVRTNVPEAVTALGHLNKNKISYLSLQTSIYSANSHLYYATMAYDHDVILNRNEFVYAAEDSGQRVASTEILYSGDLSSLGVSENLVFSISDYNASACAETPVYSVSDFSANGITMVPINTVSSDVNEIQVHSVQKSYASTSVAENRMIGGPLLYVTTSDL